MAETIEYIELQLVSVRQNHFLNHWNQITYFDTLRIFVTLVVCMVFVLYVAWYFFMFCILTYFLAYLLFRNHVPAGSCQLNNHSIVIRMSGQDPVHIPVTEIKQVLLTYKFWSNRITNPNKQVQYNALMIETAASRYIYTFIFRNSKELDQTENWFRERKSFRMVNLALATVHDLIPETAS